MRHLYHGTVLLMLLLAVTTVSDAQIKSVYTSVGEKPCKTLRTEPEEGAEYEGECPGIAGYKLRLLEGDLRHVVTPAKKTFQLAFWNISSAFSYVGERIEWRMKGKTPIALIARFNASEDPEKPEKKTSYLIVSKITKDEVCVTDVIKPSQSQNTAARKAADSAASRPCRTTDSP
jgi:hypothetical protein